MSASNAISSSRKDRPPGAPPGNGASSSSTAERFGLDGPSLTLDPRVHAYRNDIADIALAGQLLAPHYVRPLVRSCGIRPTFVRASASYEGEIVSELLPGEQFAVIDVTGHWAWGYCSLDHYVGYVEAIELVDAPPPTHIVATAQADVHAAAGSGPSPAPLPMGARITGHEDGDFIAADIGLVPLGALRPIGSFEKDPVAVAERLTGAPYLLGGRTPMGIDCSGLVQLSLMLCGISAPRDSDQQRVLGMALEDGAPLARGDLVFFEGHVGLMVDEDRLIHANVTTGNVAVEPLSDVAARKPVAERRRLG